MLLRSNVSANVVRCDHPQCKTTFPSYSSCRVVRKQAKSAGWRRVSRARVMDAFGIKAENLGGGRRLDVCPDHIPPPKERKAKATSAPLDAPLSDTPPAPPAA